MSEKVAPVEGMLVAWDRAQSMDPFFNTLVLRYGRGPFMVRAPSPRPHLEGDDHWGVHLERKGRLIAKKDVPLPFSWRWLTPAA
jgi:hypothetical protein